MRAKSLEDPFECVIVEFIQSKMASVRQLCNFWNDRHLGLSNFVWGCHLGSTRTAYTRRSRMHGVMPLVLRIPGLKKIHIELRKGAKAHIAVALVNPEAICVFSSATKLSLGFRYCAMSKSCKLCCEAIKELQMNDLGRREISNGNVVQ